MSILEIFTIISAATSILLALVAMGQAHYFNRQTSEAEGRIHTLNIEIQSGLKQIEIITDRLSKEAWSLVRESYGTMQTHILNPTSAGPAASAPAVANVIDSEGPNGKRPELTPAFILATAKRLADASGTLNAGLLLEELSRTADSRSSAFNALFSLISDGKLSISDDAPLEPSSQLKVG